MLSRLSIKNFALIEELSVQFEPGFNVLTGETGAGKSIIIDAVEVVLGGRAYEDYIRSGEQEAQLEAEFDLSDSPSACSLLRREGLLGSGEDRVSLLRELNRSGRNYSRVDGTLVTATLLRDLSRELLDIHGQHEHQSLLHTETHRRLLDHYAGSEAVRLLADVGRLYRELRGVEEELVELTGDARGRAQRRDLLEFQLRELNSCALQVGEDEELLLERRRLANVERLSQLSQEAYAMLVEGDPTSPSVAELLTQVIQRLEQLVSIDPQQQELAELVSGISYQLDDAARELRTYAEGCEYDPERLSLIEGRLDVIRTMKRKYGDTIEDILEYQDSVAEEIDRLDRAGELIGELRKRREALRHELTAACLELSRLRKERATGLQRAIEQQLADLGMGKTRVVVAVTQRTDPEDGLLVGDDDRVAFGPRGIDDVEILLSPNPGEPVKPLARIASGGELARVMLALKTISAGSFGVSTLIFDEIDAGVGGKTLRNVAKKLVDLSGSHQVICVTHQPLLASAGDAHYLVDKVEVGERTATTIQRLSDAERAREIARMLGAGPEGIPLEHARELLENGRSLKSVASTG